MTASAGKCTSGSFLLVSSVAECRVVSGSHETAERDRSPLLVVDHRLVHMDSTVDP